MLKRDYEGQNCSIARALEVVGDRWTLLVIRDIGLGHHRFDELLGSLGVASNVLTDRLNRLVAEGVLDRVRYSERPERFEYRLTKKGRELGLALLALSSGATTTSPRSRRGSRAAAATNPRSRSASSPKTDRPSRQATSSCCLDRAHNPNPAEPSSSRASTRRPQRKSA